MALTPLNDIKNWFKTNFIPTQQQFWDMFDSFRHKSDKVAATDVDGLNTLLAAKASNDVFQAHLTVNNAHPVLFGAKVDKVAGKALSDQNYSLPEKEKVAGLYDWVNNQIAGATIGSISLGSISPTTTIPDTVNVHGIAMEAGTYTNCGGVVVPANSLAFISRIGGVWTISKTAFDLSTYQKIVDGNKINTWTAKSYLLGDQVNYLGKDWVSNASTVAGDVPGTSTKWNERLNKADLVVGKNNFNYLGGDITVGYFLTNINTTFANSAYSYSGYILIMSGMAYYCNKFTYTGGAYYHFYDANKVFISSSNVLGTVAPIGAVYLRYTLNINTGFSTVQIEAGSVPTTFEVYKKMVNSDQLNLTQYSKTSEIPSLVTPLISNKADLVVGRNLFNKSTLTLNYYLDNNTPYASAGHDYSDYIPVLANTQYSSTSLMRFVSYFDSNKVNITNTLASVITFTTVANVAFVRISLVKPSTNLDLFQLELGSVSTTFEAYRKIVSNSQLDLTQYSKTTEIPAVVNAIVAPLISNKADLVVGKNKFDKSKVLIGYFLNEFNEQSVNINYDVSDFTPVTAGQVFKSTHNIRAVTYFDANKNLVSGGSGVATQNITIPSGVYFIRFSIWHTDINVFQIEVGTVSTTIEPYGKTVPDSQIPSTIQRKTDAVTLIDGCVTEPKTTFFDTSKNLFDSSEATLGYYVLSINGGLGANVNYNASGFIPVTAGQNYTMSYKHQVAWYDINKIYISGSLNTDVNKTQLAPTGAVYLRCTIHTTSYAAFQVELGSAQTTYLPYGFIFKKKYISKYLDELNLTKYDSILGNDAKIVTQASLALDSIIEVTDFPYHLKKGLSMSICADLTTFGTISYGKGYSKYRGEYFTIDATNIYQYSDSVLVITKAHGLTINTFLKSSFSVDDSCVANFILQSKTGYFKTTFQLGYEMNYEPFMRTGSQAITNIKLTVGSKEFRQPVWAFGDSYFGVGSGRWPGTMKTFGYFNFLINGLAGQGSGGAYADLLRCLNYGTPRYILWCLGMNDTNADFISYLETLKVLCTAKGIKLILSITPTVPTRDKEVIKTTLLNSGYRYIDFYKAMGANSSGVWHTGYLDADGVHPTQLGADALALQVLIDFPELMQYGKNL